MARYIDLEELEKRINENIKPETLEEKALIEWCKDECIRQAYCMPTADVVPSAEVERLQHILDCYALQYGTVKDQQSVIVKVKSEMLSEFLRMAENVCKYEERLSYEKIKDGIKRQIAMKGGAE